MSTTCENRGDVSVHNLDSGIPDLGGAVAQSAAVVAARCPEGTIGLHDQGVAHSCGHCVHPGGFQLHGVGMEIISVADAKLAGTKSRPDTPERSVRTRPQGETSPPGAACCVRGDGTCVQHARPEVAFSVRSTEVGARCPEGTVRLHEQAAAVLSRGHLDET